jgi:hypothetical protein
MKLVIIMLALVAFAYAAYAGFLTVSEYYKMSSTVDQAVANVPSERGKDRAAELKEVVLRYGRAAGIPLDDWDVTVAEKDAALKVSVRWSHPVMLIRGEPVLAYPVWVERTVPAKAEASSPR